MHAYSRFCCKLCCMVSGQLVTYWSCRTRREACNWSWTAAWGSAGWGAAAPGSSRCSSSPGCSWTPSLSPASTAGSSPSRASAPGSGTCAPSTRRSAPPARRRCSPATLVSVVGRRWEKRNTIYTDQDDVHTGTRIGAGQGLALHCLTHCGDVGVGDPWQAQLQRGQSTIVSL